MEQRDDRWKDRPSFLSGLASRLREVSEFSPRELAYLFRSLLSCPEWRDAVPLFQALLLNRTVGEARLHCDHYRQTLVTDLPDVFSVDFRDALKELPVIDRQTVVAEFENMLSRNVHLRSVCHTSGTTGQPLEIYKSHEEVDFGFKFFSALFEKDLSRLDRRPLTLSFPTPNHGVPVPVPGPGISFASGVTDDTLIRDALRVLRTRYKVAGHDDRISILSGFGYHILFFTSFLLESGVDPKDLGVKTINISGGFLPEHWRTFLQRNWGVDINDRFSLTEGVGGASRCHKCGFFKPDSNIIYEVVGERPDELVFDGVGTLLITNLNPFGQMLPLIRYETGDVVETKECDCHFCPVFKFLGRKKNCVMAANGGKTDWLMFSVTLYEELSKIPDLNIYEWFSNVRVVQDRTVGSLPILTLKNGVNADGTLTVDLEIELRYAPHLYPERVAELEKAILDALSADTRTKFRDYTEDGRLRFTIRFVGPGEIKSGYIIKI